MEIIATDIGGRAGPSCGLDRGSHDPDPAGWPPDQGDAASDQVRRHGPERATVGRARRIVPLHPHAIDQIAPVGRTAARDVRAGDLLELLATDPGSKSDVPSWASLSGNELLESGESDGVFRYVIRKA